MGSNHIEPQHRRARMECDFRSVTLPSGRRKTQEPVRRSQRLRKRSGNWDLCDRPLRTCDAPYCIASEPAAQPHFGNGNLRPIADIQTREVRRDPRTGFVPWHTLTGPVKGGERLMKRRKRAQYAPASKPE
jgi:hypothetical protein